MHDLDFSDLLQSLDPDQIAEMFFPYQQEQDALEQQMALAGQMRQPGPEHSTPMGALLGGLGNAAGNIGGAVLQNQNIEDRRALGRRQQKDATRRVTDFQAFQSKQDEDARQQAVIDFLRRRGDSAGFNTGITNWGG